MRFSVFVTSAGNRNGMPVPTERTEATLNEISNAFVRAAIRAREAGFKVAKIHMAHGYLIYFIENNGGDRGFEELHTRGSIFRRPL